MTNWDDYGWLSYATVAEGDTFLLNDISETTVGNKMKLLNLKNAKIRFRGDLVLIGSTYYFEKILRAGENLKPTVTGGCAAVAQLEVGSSNKKVVDYLAFDATTLEYAYANIVLPAEYNGGTILCQYNWTHPATTTNFDVYFFFRAVATGDGESLDGTYGAAVGVLDTGGNTSFLYTSSLTEAITIGGTPIAGETMHFRLNRYPAGETNHLAVDAYLMSIRVLFPVTI
jgi:hypothetical protein